MEIKHIHSFLLLLALATGLSLTAQTKTYYVDAAKEDNSGDGTSWATAKKDLQVALDLADAGDEIRVAAGTYLPTDAPDGTTADDRDKAFHFDKNLVLKGSYDTATNTQDYNNPSILSGDFLGDDVITGSGSSLSITMNTENANHVLITVNLTAATTIDGFTFSGGNANDFGSLTYGGQIFFRQSGGGMYNHSSSPTITNSSFSGNSAFASGGGMYNHSSSPTIDNSIFSGNSATNFGAGAYNNSSSATITNSSFHGNNAASNGGGVYNNSSPGTRIINSIFSENNAVNNGGGLYNSASSNTITNSLFSGNSANSNGGGMYNTSSSPTITNSTFSMNSANVRGAGMYNSSSSSPTLHNSVFYGNTATGAGHDIYGDDIHTDSSHNASDHTGGNINADTNFVDLTGIDPFIDSADPDGADDILGNADDGLVPHETSPLRDAGDNNQNAEMTDITGGARALGSAIDIGAYEGQVSLSSDDPVGETTTLYPNPTSSAVNLSYATATHTNYSLYDISGKRLATYIQSGTAHQLDVSTVSKGTYILKAISGLQVNYYRIVKE